MSSTRAEASAHRRASPVVTSRSRGATGCATPTGCSQAAHLVARRLPDEQAGDRRARRCEPYGGDYFGFAMVGLAVMSVARLGISTFTQNISREQTIGTLEVLLATPTRVPVLLAGSFVFPLVLTSIDMVLCLGVGLGVLGDGLRLIGVVYAVPFLLLTLASFCAFGIVGASLLVLIKRGDPLTAPLTKLTSILSGALFPVSTFPVALRCWRGPFPPTTASTACARRCSRRPGGRRCARPRRAGRLRRGAAAAGRAALHAGPGGGPAHRHAVELLRPAIAAHIASSAATATATGPRRRADGGSPSRQPAQLSGHGEVDAHGVGHPDQRQRAEQHLQP